MKTQEQSNVDKNITVKRGKENMAKGAAMELEYVVGAAILLILFVVVIGIYYQGINQTTGPTNTITEGLAFESCRLRYKTGQVDTDRDGCANNLDKCEFTIAEAKKIWTDKETVRNPIFEEGTADPITLIYLGNNYCDTDSDSVPDICDQDPTNENIGCTIGWAGGKCEPITDQEQLAKIDFEGCRKQVSDNMRVGAGGGLFS